MTTEIETTSSEDEINEAAEEQASPNGANQDAPAAGEQRSTGVGLSRSNLLLLALVVIQAGLAAFMLWPRSTVGEAGVPLLGELEASAISGLTIVEGAQEIGFEKAGSDWAVAGTGGFLTNEDSDGVNKVAAALEKLVAIDGNRLVTKTPSSHKRLQVAEDDFVRKVTVSTAEGDQTLYIGSSAGSGATHVRLDGSDEAYLTNEISSFEFSTTATSWIDTQYFSLASDEVTAFTLENGNGTFVFEREDADAEGTPGSWLLVDLAADEALDQAKVDTLVNQATNLRMTKPVSKEEDPAYGLDNAVATVTFTVQETGEDAEPAPQTVVLRVGGTPAGEGEAASTDTYAKASNAEFVVLISEFSANQILDKQRTDFLVDEEEGVESPDSANDGAIVPSFEEAAAAADSGGAFTVAEPLTTTEVLTITGEITGGGSITESAGITITGSVTE